MTQNELRIDYLQKLGYKVNNILVDENRTIIDLESYGQYYNLTLWGSDGFECSDVLKVHLDRTFCPYCKSNLTGRQFQQNLGRKITCMQCGAFQFTYVDRIIVDEEEEKTGWIRNRDFERALLIDEDDISF